MLDKYNRRDFLSLLKITAYTPFVDLDGDYRQEIDLNSLHNELLEQNIYPEIVELGDKKMMMDEGTPADGSNGFRASYVSNNGQTIIGGTQMGRYYISSDSGKNFKGVEFPITHRNGMFSPTPRDIIELNTRNEWLVINDYNIDLLTKKSSDEFVAINIFPTENEARTLQTAVSLPNGLIIAGGSSIVGGLMVAEKNQVLNTISQNKQEKYKYQEFKWENLYEYGNSRQSLIRSIHYEPVNNVVYIGGWSTPNNFSPIGMGVLCLDGETLEKIDHPYNFKDDMGEMPVNTIKVIQYKNSEVMVQGMERSGVFKKDGYLKHSNTNFLKIWVNGVVLSDDTVNCTRLAKYGNGWDIVSCGPGGVETIEINGKKYLAVCMFGGGICIGDLDEVLAGNKINWQRITYAPEGQSGFNAFRAKTITNLSTNKQELVVSRLSWKGGGPQRFARISF